MISVEDLWDLSISDIDKVYTSINHALKATKDEGLLVKKDEKIETMELQLGIIKHVYETKTAEAKQRVAEYEKKEKLRRIDEIITKKQDSELEGKTIEELTAMREEFRTPN
jgi:hypothetical protein